ncbi:fructose-specific PTS transporter subunit EIIC [Kocuria palustris]|uniref:fructose-specific PTS transporter subunit EIIC n=1 Tax=Kocuria palustris TaxID=71999 RepID=UPI0011A9C6A4|nr:fructose-specific PTS transporter subunit EIIC [Kocuria palustris]
MSGRKRILAITACPTGIAHTFMAAEKLEEAARDLGYDIAIETHGSIGVEGAFTDEQIAEADAVVVAADKQIEMTRFAGLPVASAGVAEGIHHPRDLIERALGSEVLQGERAVNETAGVGSGRMSPLQSVYKALMNGVSHMIPFVVTGGLLIAISLTLGGDATAEGLVIPEGTFWWTINQIGVLGFTVMVPVLSGYIAYAIADRPGLAPGMITGFIAVTGSLYGSEAGAGFLGGILTGFACGYVALALKRIPVHKYIQPIMPIIVIPVVTSVVVGLLFVYLVGAPVASFFGFLTDWLAGMDGTSAVVLGVILGAMIGSDMGGPINKTAFLFGGGLIAAGNPGPMGMAAAAIAVPPLGMGLATLLRRAWFTPQERESGIAALFMGFFGITEGAIPFAAARPLQVIPANMIGGAVAGGLAGLAGVGDHVMHGGPIVAVLGAVDNTVMFFVSALLGTAVTAGAALALMGVQRRRMLRSAEQTAAESPSSPDGEPAQESGSGPGGSTALTSDDPVRTASSSDPQSHGGVATAPRQTGEKSSRRAIPLREYLREPSVLLDEDLRTRDDVLRALAARGAASGQIADVERVVASALSREEQGSTGVGSAIAIPHAKSDGAASPFIGFARLADPIEWSAAAAEPVRLVFLIAVPEHAAGTEHLKILANLSRSLARTEVKERLVSASTAEEVIAALEMPKR